MVCQRRADRSSRITALAGLLALGGSASAHIALQPCPDSRALCGDVVRPLDPTGRVAGSVSIHFEFYAHSGRGPSRGTLVATEGGPGYPATLSRADYLALFGPLMTHRDVVIMDNRGTGRSGTLDCPMLQTADAWSVDAVAACGAHLGDRASLYGTEFAVDDLAAILEDLGIERIDLYGDSYGTYFEQVFAVRHPQLLRSVVLDGAYPLSGPDYPWYPNYAPAMRHKFNAACARSAACAALPGDSIEHILPALQRLRAAPEPAAGYDSDGRERHFTADASQLAIVMFGNAPAFSTLRELDAAARAYAGGDRAPLLRLMAETAAAVDSRDPTDDVRQWSAGLAAAVMCQDPPQIYDMRLAPDERVRDRDRALAARRSAAPDTYAPFSIDEYRGMPLDYAFLDQCVRWPVSPAARPAGQVGLHAVYPDVPALVVSGEFDDITAPADGAAVAAAFPRGVQVRLANSFHVNALPRGRSGCAALLVRRFIVSGRIGDDACTTQVAPVRLLPAFATRSTELMPAQPRPGNAAGPAQLAQVSAAVMTAGDVAVRAGNTAGGSGRGLRGGNFVVRAVRTVRGGSPMREVILRSVRWTEDLAVSGRLRLPAGRSGRVRATLEVLCDDGAAGNLSISWPVAADAVPLQPPAAARVTGTLGKTTVLAETPAP